MSSLFDAEAGTQTQTKCVHNNNECSVLVFCDFINLPIKIEIDEADVLVGWYTYICGNDAINFSWGFGIHFHFSVRI